MPEIEVLKHDFSSRHWKRGAGFSPEERKDLLTLSEKVGKSILGFDSCAVNVSDVESELLDFCFATELHNMVAHRRRRCGW